MDEEHGQGGSRALVGKGLKVDLALVGEPTRLQVVTAHKGDLWLQLETRGRAAHGSQPELGRNAVHEMARIVDLLETTYAAVLRKRGLDESLCRAILSHADYSGVPRATRMEKALFAADELSGFVIAVALVRPTKRLADVDVASVKKKMKDKAFAKGVRREDIVKGAEEMGMPLEEHIAAVIAALQGIAPELGLDGVGC